MATKTRCDVTGTEFAHKTIRTETAHTVAVDRPGCPALPAAEGEDENPPRDLRFTVELKVKGRPNNLDLSPDAFRAIVAEAVEKICTRAMDPRIA